jgi:hypothetical protein
VKPHLMQSTETTGIPGGWLCSLVARFLSYETGRRGMSIETPYGRGETPAEAYRDWMQKTPGY